MRRRLPPLAGALLAALALAACGEKTDRLTPTSSRTQSLNLMLDWLPNADHVGIYQALADGAFRAAGLNVVVRAPANPATPLQLLQAGKVDAAVSYEPDLMLARDKGAPLVAIGAIVQRPLTSIISLRSKHITSPAKLRGKRVGDAGIPYQHAYLQTILKHAGVPASSVNEVNVGDNLVGSLLTVSVILTALPQRLLGYRAIQLQQAGEAPERDPRGERGRAEVRRTRARHHRKALATKTSELRSFVQAAQPRLSVSAGQPSSGESAL